MRKIRNWNIKRAKKYWLGRVLCRLAGDEKGAVMMEYVIVAVLIAAACVVAVAMFGRTIVGQFGVAANAGAGDTVKAQDINSKVKTDASENAKTAATYHDSFHNSKDFSKTAAGGSDSNSGNAAGGTK